MIMPLPSYFPDFLAEASLKVKEIYSYWDSLRRGSAIPRFSDFDPTHLPAHLPGIILVEAEGLDSNGTGIFRYRVVGSDEVANRGFDPTGKLVQEGYFSSSQEDAIASYEAVRKNRSFLYEPIEFVSKDGIPVDEFSILLPLSEDGKNVSHILVYSESRQKF